MSINSDWRLSRGQKDYLDGKTLIYKVFPKDKRQPERHVHCEFCWETISPYLGDENEAYQTEDQKFWICRKCFHDFNKMFNWKLG